jgi:hypothetical protein
MNLVSNMKYAKIVFGSINSFLNQTVYMKARIMTQYLPCSLTIEAEKDTYKISQYLNSMRFGVTSKHGLDTVSNGVTFNTIQAAIKYVENLIKNDF